jgi:hypothetical protein
MRNGLTLADAGMAVMKKALGKALTQLALAQSAARVTDADIAAELDKAVAQLAALQKRISTATAHRCRSDANDWGSAIGIAPDWRGYHAANQDEWPLSRLQPENPNLRNERIVR